MSSALATDVAHADYDADHDADGYPDVIELRATSERRAFMDWFAAVAEAQYVAISADWDERYQDCSGLLRYAFREALKPKPDAWFDKFAALRVSTPPPVPAYPMPHISRSIFRRAPGPYHEDDVHHGKLVGVASAEELMRYSSSYLGHHPQVAQRGDLLFFSHPLAEGTGFHSMVFLGRDNKGESLVVYHTGVSAGERGEVRLVRLSTLNKHPDPSWHATTYNPSFLGFYRWNIVN